MIQGEIVDEEEVMRAWIEQEVKTRAETIGVDAIALVNSAQYRKALYVSSRRNYARIVFDGVKEWRIVKLEFSDLRGFSIKPAGGSPIWGTTLGTVVEHIRTKPELRTEKVAGEHAKEVREIADKAELLANNTAKTIITGHDSNDWTVADGFHRLAGTLYYYWDREKEFVHKEAYLGIRQPQSNFYNP